MFLKVKPLMLPSYRFLMYLTRSSFNSYISQCYSSRGRSSRFGKNRVLSLCVVSYRVEGHSAVGGKPFIPSFII